MFLLKVQHRVSEAGKPEGLSNVFFNFGFFFLFGET